MIVKRYLLKEITFTFAAVTVLLLLIFLSGTFVRILADAAEGDYPAKIVFTLFGLKGIANVVLVLPLALFLSVLLALGRLYKDSEMAAMAACGIGPDVLLKATGVLAVAVAGFVAVLALYLAPRAEEQGHRLMDEAEASAEVDGIMGGRFHQAATENYMLYVEEIGPRRRILRNVFVHERKNGEVRVLSAASGYRYTDPKTGDRFLVLADGSRYEGTPGTPDFKIVRFKQHGVRIEERTVVRTKRRRNAISSAALWASTDPGDIAEFQWRISLPISALLMALAAVPLAKTSPRGGRYGRLFAGILLYIIYNNLLTVARAWVGKGTVAPWLGMWWVHVLLLIIIAAMVYRQGRLPAPAKQPEAAVP